MEKLYNQFDPFPNVPSDTINCLESSIEPNKNNARRILSFENTLGQSYRNRQWVEELNKENTIPANVTVSEKSSQHSRSNMSDVRAALHEHSHLMCDKTLLNDLIKSIDTKLLQQYESKGSSNTRGIIQKTTLDLPYLENLEATNQHFPDTQELIAGISGFSEEFHTPSKVLDSDNLHLLTPLKKRLSSTPMTKCQPLSKISNDPPRIVNQNLDDSFTVSEISTGTDLVIPTKQVKSSLEIAGFNYENVELPLPSRKDWRIMKPEIKMTDNHINNETIRQDCPSISTESLLSKHVTFKSPPDYPVNEADASVISDALDEDSKATLSGPSLVSELLIRNTDVPTEPRVSLETLISPSVICNSGELLVSRSTHYDPTQNHVSINKDDLRRECIVSFNDSRMNHEQLKSIPAKKIPTPQPVQVSSKFDLPIEIIGQQVSTHSGNILSESNDQLRSSSLQPYQGNAPSIDFRLLCQELSANLDIEQDRRKVAEEFVVSRNETIHKLQEQLETMEHNLKSEYDRRISETSALKADIQKVGTENVEILENLKVLAANSHTQNLSTDVYTQTERSEPDDASPPCVDSTALTEALAWERQRVTVLLELLVTQEEETIRAQSCLESERSLSRRQRPEEMKQSKSLSTSMSQRSFDSDTKMFHQLATESTMTQHLQPPIDAYVFQHKPSDCPGNSFQEVQPTTRLPLRLCKAHSDNSSSSSSSGDDFSNNDGNQTVRGMHDVQRNESIICHSTKQYSVRTEDNNLSQFNPSESNQHLLLCQEPKSLPNLCIRNDSSSEILQLLASVRPFNSLQYCKDDKQLSNSPSNDLSNSSRQSSVVQHTVNGSRIPADTSSDIVTKQITSRELYGGTQAANCRGEALYTKPDDNISQLGTQSQLFHHLDREKEILMLQLDKLTETQKRSEVRLHLEEGVPMISQREEHRGQYLQQDPSLVQPQQVTSLQDSSPLSCYSFCSDLPTRDTPL